MVFSILGWIPSERKNWGEYGGDVGGNDTLREEEERDRPRGVRPREPRVGVALRGVPSE